MATNKLHQSVGSSKSPDGFQNEVVTPCNSKLVTEAEEPVTVSTNCGQVGAVRVGNFPGSIPHFPSLLPCFSVGGLVAVAVPWGQAVCCFRGSPGSCLCALELS